MEEKIDLRIFLEESTEIDLQRTEYDDRYFQLIRQVGGVTPGGSTASMIRTHVLKYPHPSISAESASSSGIVPIGQYAGHYIRLYLEKGRKRLLLGRHTDPGNLFLTSRGTPFSRQTINRSVMGRANRTLNGTKRISCYSLLSMAATHLIANGADIAYVAQLLGHESLRYLRIEIGDLEKMHALYHPREHERGLDGLS